jgi:hypothetical protein
MFNQSTIQQKELPKVMQSSGCILFKTSHEISCKKKAYYRIMNMWKVMQSFDQYNTSSCLLQDS